MDGLPEPVGNEKAGKRRFEFLDLDYRLGSFNLENGH